MTRRFYTLVMPSGSQLSDEQSVRANLSELGQLDGAAAVEKLSQQPGGLSLRGQIRDQEYAVLMAGELRELGNSDDIDAVPLFTTGTETESDGFYAVDQVRRVGPKRPPAEEVQEFDLSVSRKGTRYTHWSAIATNEVDIAADNFDSNGDAPGLYVIQTASDTTRQWYDAIAGESAPAHDPAATVAHEFEDLDKYGLDRGRAATMAQDAATVLYRNGVEQVNWTSQGNGTTTKNTGNLFGRGTDGDNAIWRTGSGVSVDTVDWITFDVDVTDLAGSGEVEIGTALNVDTITSTGRRWYLFDASGLSGDVNPATKAITSSSGDVAEFKLYDAALVSEDRRVPEPSLLYDIPYDDVGRADPTLWDDRGNANKVDSTYGDSSSSAVAWQRVFATDHEFIGQAVADNGRIRVFIDEDAESMTAERWGGALGQWNSVSLGSSDWRPVDVDPIRIGTAELELEVQFTDDGRHYALRLVLPRGQGNPQWLRPPEETRSVPSGLQTKLDPIAGTQASAAQPRDGLVARSEVRD